MRWDTQATICAIATGNVASNRGAIRIAGSDTLAILRSIVDLNINSRAAIRSTVSFPLGTPFGSLPVDLWLWPTNRSYTGSPSAELHMIGNQVLLNRAIQVLAVHGAKVAEPGEFTLRAFLSGRMDLTQCEAVLGAIHATTDRQFELALQQLAGGLSKPLRVIRKSLIELLADLEAGLDFVDEDISFVSADEVLRRIGDAQSIIAELLLQLSHRNGTSRSVEVVLTGRSNAGKSSLVNALIGSPVSIVNQQPGTTRDYLRAKLTLAGREVELIDTAGLDSVPFSRSDLPSVEDRPGMGLEEIEGLAKEMTILQRQTARLVLYCIDSSLDEESRSGDLIAYQALLKEHSDTWLVWTKCDSSEMKNRLTDSGQSTIVFWTSSKHAKGLQGLVESIFKWQASEESECSMVVGSTAVRCLGSLHDANDALGNAVISFRDGGDEIVASELRFALDAIGAVAGDVCTDDILDALFSRFCIGK